MSDLHIERGWYQDGNTRVWSHERMNAGKPPCSVCHGEPLPATDGPNGEVLPTRCGACSTEDIELIRSATLAELREVL